MAKPDDRPVDAGIALVRTKPDAEAVEWWKGRFALVAGVPSDIARAGALLPQMRELSRLPEADRRRLTKARMQAFMAIPSDQRQLILAARKLTYAADPDLVRGEDQLVQQLVPEVPGAGDIAQQTE